MPPWHGQWHGDGAQAAHDAANAQRVAHGLFQSEFLGNVKVGHRGRLVAPDEGDLEVLCTHDAVTVGLLGQMVDFGVGRFQRRGGI